MSAIRTIRRSAGALVVTAAVAALLVVGGRPAAAGDEGPLSDYLHPASQQAITVDESYQAYSVLGRPFLYQPGPGLDRAVFGYSGTSLTTTVGNVPGGPHVVGASAESALVVFHAPGPETDHIWSRG